MKKFNLFYGLICLSAFLCTYAAFGQTRMIPHVTPPGASFETNLVLTNESPYSQTIRFQPYHKSGAKLSVKTFTLSAGQRYEANAQDFFSSSDVSHFSLTAHELVEVTAVYRALVANASPAHVKECPVQASSWTLSPGNWDQTYDAIAVVNMGASAAKVEVVQRDANGYVTDRKTLDSALAPMSKTLSLISASFSHRDNASYEIVCSQPVSIIALRGNLASTLFWENAVKANRQYNYIQTELLEGYWQFTYTISSDFHEFYSMNMLGTQMNSDGNYTIYGVNKWGKREVSAIYSGKNDVWALLDRGDTGSGQYYVFQLDNGQLSGCEYRVSSDNELGDCRDLVGKHIDLPNQVSEKKAKYGVEEAPFELGIYVPEDHRDLFFQLLESKQH